MEGNVGRETGNPSDQEHLSSPHAEPEESGSSTSQKCPFYPLLDFLLYLVAKHTWSPGQHLAAFHQEDGDGPG